MRLPNILRVLNPLPTTIIMAVALPFLSIGLGQVWKTYTMVNNYSTAAGIVISNDYQSRTDPQNNAKTYWSYHPVVRFTTRQGQELVFTDPVGSYPADYQAGDSVDVLYDPEDPHDAAIRSWERIWVGPLWLTAIGLLPILGLLAWTAWQYTAAERRMQVSRNLQ